MDDNIDGSALGRLVHQEAGRIRDRNPALDPHRCDWQVAMTLGAIFRDLTVDELAHAELAGGELAARERGEVERLYAWELARHVLGLLHGRDPRQA